MTNKLKVGIVGAPRGQSFVRSFQAIEEIGVTAICDLNIDTAERVANQFNIDQKYTEFDKDDTIRSIYCSGVNTNAFACPTIDYCLAGR